MNPKHHRRRAFSSGLAMHVVLKANVSVFHGARVSEIVDRVLLRFGKHFAVTVYHRALVGNNLHLVLAPKTQTGLSGFLRVVAGQISLKVSKSKAPFWQQRPWSTLVQWGRHYNRVVKYVALNYLEGRDLIKRVKNIGTELKKYEKWISQVLKRGLTQLAANESMAF